MTSNWYSPVLERRSVLEPLETGMTPKLKSIDGIKAVIFDIYGTLVISGTGDVGSADDSEQDDAIAAAMEALGISTGSGRRPTMDDLHECIRSSNESRTEEACPKPEVDITEIWRLVIERCGMEPLPTETVHRLSAEYEARANPTWPMPGAQPLLGELAQKGLRLGIVSNAQGFTLPLVEDLGGVFGVDSVFDLNLCVFSYRYRQAKPGPRLFEVLCGGLEHSGISPDQAIYVGNDRLNDVWAASQAGLRTAWFVGDDRSMRPREGDDRVASLPHDLILTDLPQLIRCV